MGPAGHSADDGGAAALRFPFYQQASVVGCHKLGNLKGGAGTLSVNRVFISYAREDVEHAKRVYADLRSAGASPWLDVEDLVPGEDWQLAITRAIKQSTYFLFLMSERSLAKRGFGQKELRLALEVLDEIPAGEIFLIPARLEPCNPIEPKLQALHRVDLFPSYDVGLKTLLRAVVPRPTVVPQGDPYRCPHCGNTVQGLPRNCPTCAADLGFPNVRHAAMEASQLDQRYNLALERAQVYGSYERVLEFASAVRSARAVVTMTLDRVVRLLQSESGLYGPYVRALSLGERTESQARSVADALMFPFYGGEIVFGCLALEGRGLTRYGECSIVLHEHAVAHRVTLTETDSFSMVAGHLLDAELPRGFRCTWDRKDKLAVAKLGHLIRPNTQPETFGTLLLNDAADPKAAEFIELQIYGAISKLAIASINVRPTPGRTQVNLLSKMAVELCRRDGIAITIER